MVRISPRATNPVLGGGVPGVKSVDFRATFFRSALLEAVIAKTGKRILDNCPSSPSAQESVDGDTSCQGWIPRLVGIPGRRAGARFPYAMLLVVAMLCYASGGSQEISKRQFREAPAPLGAFPEGKRRSFRCSVNRRTFVNESENVSVFI